MSSIMTHPFVGRRSRLLVLGATLAGVVACGIPADAQPPAGRGGRGAPAIGRGGPGGRGGTPEQMIERRVARLTEALQLSEVQAAQITTILTEEHAKMEALRPDERPTTPPDSAARAQMRERHEALREETTERITAVLSAEQRAKYAELEQRGPGGRVGRGMRGAAGPDGPGFGRGGRGSPGGPLGGRMENPEQMIDARVARLTEALALSETQTASVRTILAEEQAQVAALRPAERSAQRPDSATMAATRASVEAIHNGAEAKVEALLTAEQKAKWAELREERGPRGRGGFGGRGGLRAPPPVGR